MAHPDTLNKKTITAKLPLGALAEFIYELYEALWTSFICSSEAVPIWTPLVWMKDCLCGKNYPPPTWLTKSLSLMRPLLASQCSRGSLLCHCLISPKHKHRRSHVPHAHPGCSQLHGWQSTIMLWRQTTYVRAILTTVGEWLQYKSYLMSVLHSEECAGEESHVLFTKDGLHFFHKFFMKSVQ